MSKFNKKILLKILEDKTPDERMEWFKSLNDIELVEVSSLLTTIAEDIPELMSNKQTANKITDFKINTGLLNNMNIDEEVNDMMKEIEFQAELKAIDEEYIKMRTALKKHLLQDPTDTYSIEIAEKFIEAEKLNYDYYQEENWKEIFHLLKNK